MGTVKQPGFLSTLVWMPVHWHRVQCIVLPGPMAGVWGLLWALSCPGSGGSAEVSTPGNPAVLLMVSASGGSIHSDTRDVTGGK